MPNYFVTENVLDLEMQGPRVSEPHSVTNNNAMEFLFQYFLQIGCIIGMFACIAAVSLNIAAVIWTHCDWYC